MKMRYSFRNMDTSESLIQYAESKLADKIEKYVTKPIDIHLTFRLQGHEKVVHCSFKGGDNFNFEVEHGCSDMYASVDLLSAKFETQLKKHKEKLKHHKGVRHFLKLVAEEQLAPMQQDSFYNWEEEPVDAEDVARFEVSRRKAMQFS